MPLTQLIALTAWLLLTIGVFCRRTKNVHAPLMLCGIGLDVSLVLYLQITRHAVQKAASFTLAPLHQTHIAFSTLALLLYLPVVYLGLRLWTVGMSPRWRSRHVRLGAVAYIFRTLGLFFMFLI